MVSSQAATPAQYLASLPDDRRKALAQVRKVIRKNLGHGHMAVYLMCVDANSDIEAWFHAAWAKTGKKLNMGKSCVRFKKIEDVALDVIGETVAKMTVENFIAGYEEARAKKKVTKRR